MPTSSAALAASWLLVLSFLPIAGGAQTAPSGSLGQAKDTPLEVCRPKGERDYLARLVCPTGETPTFVRTGNVGYLEDFPTGVPKEVTDALLNKLLRFEPLGPGDPHVHVIDRYRVSCKDFEAFAFFDMYHCDKPAPTVPLRGFSLKEQEN